MRRRFSKKYRIRIFCLLAAALMAAGAVFCTVSAQRELSRSILRLHVVANSDSEADQALKAEVRDAVVEKWNEYAQGLDSIGETKELASRVLPVLEQTARETAQVRGFDYAVEAKLERTVFPTRDYGGFSLPAGEYDAVLIKLGRAEGKNWWCVMFPPLCGADGDRAEVEGLCREDGVNAAGIRLMTGDGAQVKFSFRLLELLYGQGLGG